MSQVTKQAQYEARLAFAIAQTVIHSDFARVPSTSGKQDMYTVKISKNNFAYECNCDATIACIHITAVNEVLATQYSSFYERIGMKKVTPDEVAAQAEAINMQKLADFRNAYEVLATTKHVPFICPCCGQVDNGRCEPGKCYWLPLYEAL